MIISNSMSPYHPDPQLRKTGTVDQYHVKSVTNLALVGTGPRILTPTTPLEVAAGDIMGIEYTSALAGQLTLVASAPTSDMTVAHANANSGAVYSGGSATGTRHALQAMFSAGSKVQHGYVEHKVPVQRNRKKHNVEHFFLKMM